MDEMKVEARWVAGEHATLERDRSDNFEVIQQCRTQAYEGSKTHLPGTHGGLIPPQINFCTQKPVKSRNDTLSRTTPIPNTNSNKNDNKSNDNHNKAPSATTAPYPGQLARQIGRSARRVAHSKA